MNCAWEALVRLLPGWIRQQVDPRGRESLRELRLRLGRPPELVGVRESGSRIPVISPPAVTACPQRPIRWPPGAVIYPFAAVAAAQGE